MPKTRTITLREPIRDSRGVVRTITLREPRAGDLIELCGLPAIWVSLPGGGGFLQDSPILWEWIGRLAESSIDPDYLPSLSLRDALAVRCAVINFFIDASAPAAATGEVLSEDEQVMRIN